MASLRRSKVLSPDGQTAKFLYTIIKQLDLKTIDWNEVASGLEITNGHAARMRYSRFKAQIEGLPTQTKPRAPRAPRPKKDASAAAKGKAKNKPGYEPGKVDDLMVDEDDGDGDVKMEQDVELRIKQEDPMVDTPLYPGAPSDDIKIKQEPGLRTESSSTQDEAASIVKVKQEPQVELASYPLSPTSGIAAMKLNPSSMSPPPRPLVGSLGCMPNPPNSFPQHYPPLPRMPPPHATVSLADLQLPPMPPPPGGQMLLPTFSYPLPQMNFDFDFNAPIIMPPQQQPQLQFQQPWQPQFDMFRPVGGGGGVVKRERID